MTAQPLSPLQIVSCGIFRRELELLGPDALRGAKPIFLDSMLHMHPQQLDDRLTAMLKTQQHPPTLIIYGDCSPHMGDLARQPGVRKVRGVNCCDIMLGRERYRSLRRQGAFFFLPEWTMRWQDVFKIELGLASEKLAREFMHDLHKRLIYIDTKAIPVPRSTLAAIETYFAMPVEILPATLAPLAQSLALGMEELRDG